MERWTLPEGWEWKILGRLASADADKIRPADFPDEDFEYLGLSDIAERAWGEVKASKVKGEKIRSSSIRFDTQHVLYSKLRPYLNKVVVPLQTGIGSAEFVPLIPDPSQITREYLAWYLRSPWFVRYASQNSTGARMPRIRMTSFWEASVPVPPLSIQRRIVARVEAAFTELTEARRTHAALVQDAERVMDAIYVEAFSAKDLLAAATWVSIGDVGQVSGGLTKNRGRRSYPLRLPYLRVANVYANRLQLEDVQTIGVLESELDRVLLQKNDLLIVEGNGSVDQIGRVAVWDGSITPCVHQNHIIKLRFDSHQLTDYVLHWLLSPKGRAEIVRVASSTSGLYTLSLSKVSAFPIPLVSDERQRQLVDHFSKARKQINGIQHITETVTSDLDRLEQSILSRAFQGKL